MLLVVLLDHLSALPHDRMEEVVPDFGALDVLNSLPDRAGGFASTPAESFEVGSLRNEQHVLSVKVHFCFFFLFYHSINYTAITPYSINQLITQLKLSEQ